MAVIKGKKPHVLAVPFPAQGHVKPLMKLSRQIARHGIKVTFVNIECIHEKIVAAAKMSAGDEEDGQEDDNIVLTTVPDGRSPDDDRNDSFKLLESLRNTMPGFLTGLIESINSSNGDERVSCVIADITIGWILETAEKMGAEPVVFSPPSAAALAIILHIPRLLEEGNLDSNGTIEKDEMISLSENIPAWRQNELTWSFPVDLETQKIFFECSLTIEKTIIQAKWLLSSTCYDLESAACDLIPGLLPIGPLLETKNPKSLSNSCNFHPEDASCLRWLDDKPPGSVVYVSFGSLAVLSQQQLDELALGLELSGRAFLWVVRPDLANGSRAVYPDGFLERVGELGKIVDWAPQERVLSHRSVACFLSHCGWNSTLEGLSYGVPFLCWPYFADQHHNQNYICDKWEIGVRIDLEENGIRTRHEITTKIEMLFSDGMFKENAMKVKAMCGKSVGEGGCSYKNFKTFVDHIRK
ncbi:UDP-glycosyltransferase 83A1 [Sesamum alatum]|uniref:UDP-glycosyltransferase 83A1 n=1 Tax=Sesamum alatum TaxID=300844 RepID=A0AAE1YSG3_9LAMI|nr:UDP-glycosyltransferase 83A1 [Sesamum alatum]